MNKQQNKLPTGWQEVKLINTIECVENGNRPKGGVGSLNEGIPSIGGEHINNNGGFNFLNIKFISNEFFNVQKRGIIQLGDVLVVKDGATTGRVTLVSKEKFPYKKALVNEHVFILRPKEGTILPEFLFYFLFSKSGQKQILDNFHGSAQGGINTQFVKNVKFILPLLSTQKKIVEILEKAEKLKQKREIADKKTAEYLKSVFYELFLKGKHERTNLGNERIFEVQSGGTPSRAKKEYWENGTIPWIGSTVCKDLPVYEAEQFITEEGLKNSSAKVFKKDAVLIALVGATIGKTGFLMFGSATNQNIAAVIIKDKNKIDPLYLFYAAKQLYSKFTSLSNDTFKMANLSFIRTLQIPLPPIPIQQKFAKIVEKVEKMKEKQKESKEKIENLFNSLMQKAFKGELVR